MLPLFVQDKEHTHATCSSGQRPLRLFWHTVSDQKLDNAMGRPGNRATAFAYNIMWDVCDVDSSISSHWILVQY